MSITQHEYTNGEITVVWQPEKCIHSAYCVKGLGDVFNPNVRPWVNIQAASSEKIAEQVGKCPSGALTCYKNSEKLVEGSAEPFHAEQKPHVEVLPNGPLLVHGDIQVKLAGGDVVRKTKVTAFCRCGAAGTKPYCDGSHSKAGFQG